MYPETENMLPSSNNTCSSPCCPGITFPPESYKKHVRLNNKITKRKRRSEKNLVYILFFRRLNLYNQPTRNYKLITIQFGEPFMHIIPTSRLTLHSIFRYYVMDMTVRDYSVSCSRGVWNVASQAHALLPALLPTSPLPNFTTFPWLVCISGLYPF